MRKNKKIKLSVVMPTLNEEKSIAKVISDIKKYTNDYDLEILIIDSSTDDTPKIAEKMGVEVFRQEPQGPGKAIIFGLLKSKGEIIITADCDDTYPLEDIPKFIDLWVAGYDFVNGNRLNKMNRLMPSFNRLGNWFFAFLMRVFFGVNTKDVTSGMRLYSRELINSSKWETNYSFWTEIIIKAKLNGFKFKEIPIKYKIRIGVPKINIWKSGKAFLLCILKYRFNLDFIDSKKL